MSGVLVLAGCAGAPSSAPAAEPAASPAVTSAAGPGAAGGGTKSTKSQAPGGDDSASVTGGLSSPAAKTATRFDKLRKAEEAAKAAQKVNKAAEKAARKAARAARKAGKKAQAGTATSGAAASTPALPKTEAATRYDEISQAYVAGSKELVHLLDSGHTDQATLRDAVRKAADAYDARIAALKHTAWPATAQPYVDNYLSLATTVGRDLFERARDAKSLADLRHPSDVRATFELDHAEEAMAARLAPKN